MQQIQDTADTRQALDLESFFRFVLAIAGQRGMLTFQTFDDAKRSGRGRPSDGAGLVCQSHHRADANGLKAARKELSELNGRGAGVYLTINETDGTGRKTSNIVAVRAFFVEFDAKDGQVAPDEWPLEPSIIVRSKGGLHVYWLVDGAPLDEFKRVQKALIKRFGSDKSINNLDRVMRLPGFLHLKDPSDPFLVELVRCKKDRRYSYPDFCAAMGVPEEAPAAQAVASLSTPQPRKETRADTGAATGGAVLPPIEERRRRLARYLDKYGPAVEGQHGDDRTYRVGHLVGDFGLTVAEAWPELEVWNGGCSPPWDPTELRDKLERASQNREGVFGSRVLIVGPPGSGIDDDDRPVVELGPDLHHVVERSVAHLAELPDVYRHAGALVELDRTHGPRELRSPGDHRVLQLLSMSSRFVAEGKQGPKPTKPPLELARCVAQHPLGPVRRLEAVVQAPVLREDGTVVVTPGYDEASGLYLALDGPWPDIPEMPTAGEVEAAVLRLEEIIVDFPFATVGDRSAWMSTVLTVLGRDAFEGPSPLAFVSASTPGTGKGLLVQATAEIVLGRSAPLMTQSSSVAEEKKSITAKLMEAPRMLVWDNIAGPFGSPVLDALLTSDIWEDRVLGVSRVVRVPNKTLYLATGNNPSFVGDLPRRVLPIRLSTDLERPEERSGFRYPDLLAHVRRHRKELVIAGLTILRGYIAAGRPDPGLRRWGSYEGWSALVRGALVWAGRADPIEARADIEVSADDGQRELRAMLLAWSGSQGVTGRAGMTASQALERAGTDLRLADAIHDATGEMNPSPRRLGCWLRKHRGRVVGGTKFVSRDNGKGTCLWSAESVARPVTVSVGHQPEVPAAPKTEHGKEENDRPEDDDLSMFRGRGRPAISQEELLASLDW